MSAERLSHVWRADWEYALFPCQANCGTKVKVGDELVLVQDEDDSHRALIVHADCAPEDEDDES